MNFDYKINYCPMCGRKSNARDNYKRYATIGIYRKVNNAVENSNCNLTTCRYNNDGKCTKEEKRKECVEVSRKVMGIGISVDAVNEYAKSILGRYPKDNMEFLRALAMKILEETKLLANSTKKE